VETSNGWVIIDHKSFPGKRSQWETEALSYSGQIASYRLALEQTGKPVAGLWIHFMVGGGLIEIKT